MPETDNTVRLTPPIKEGVTIDHRSIQALADTIFFAALKSLNDGNKDYAAALVKTIRPLYSEEEIEKNTILSLEE